MGLRTCQWLAAAPLLLLGACGGGGGGNQPAVVVDAIADNAQVVAFCNDVTVTNASNDMGITALADDGSKLELVAPTNNQGMYNCGAQQSAIIYTAADGSRYSNANSSSWCFDVQISKADNQDEVKFDFNAVLTGVGIQGTVTISGSADVSPLPGNGPTPANGVCN